MKKNHLITIKNELIDLYLYLKGNNNKEKEDITYLEMLDEITLIKYIKDSIDISISKLAEKRVNDYNNKLSDENIQQDYESLLIKYEKDIRGHIKTEHQLKLYSESLQNNIEELEKEKNEYISDNKDYKDIIKKKNKEINKLKRQINQNKKLLESNELQKKLIKDNEIKLKNNIKKYEIEIEKLNKKIKYYEILFSEDADGDGIERDLKNNTIYCNTSRTPIIVNSNTDSKEIPMNKTFRNMNKIFNDSKSINSTKPYEKNQKFVSHKYCKKNKNQKSYKIKNIKNLTDEHIIEKSITFNNINENNLPNHTYINESNNKEDENNKLITNNSTLNVNNNNSITSKKSRTIYDRHKSIENANEYLRNKPLGLIKKIFVSSDNNNSIKILNKAKYKEIMANTNIKFKKNMNSINSTINSTNKYIINNNINNAINFSGNAINNGARLVNNINNNIQQKIFNNIYIGSNIKNLKKNAGNYTERQLNSIANTNIARKIFINYRNKQKEKMNFSISDNF